MITKDLLLEMQRMLIGNVVYNFEYWYNEGLFVVSDEYSREVDVELNDDLQITIDFHKPSYCVTYNDVRNVVLGSRFQDAYEYAVRDAYESLRDDYDLTEEEWEYFEEDNKYHALLLPRQDCVLKYTSVKLPWCYNLFGGGVFA